LNRVKRRGKEAKGQRDKGIEGQGPGIRGKIKKMLDTGLSMPDAGYSKNVLLRILLISGIKITTNPDPDSSGGRINRYIGHEKVQKARREFRHG
jgi:hypothetical protein